MADENNLKEENLKESEEKYRALIETTDTGFVILDGRGLVVDANSEYVRLTGYRRLDEILGRSVTEWTAEHDRKRNALEVKKCFEQGFVRNLNIDYAGKDGRIIPIEINATVVETKNGPLIVTLCRDITERRKAETALWESEERFRTIIEQSPLSMQIMNPDGRTIKVNGAWEKLWGITLDDLKGYNILKDEQLENLGLMPFIRKGFTGEPTAVPPALYDTRKTLGTGAAKWVQSSIYPVRNEKGNILIVVLMHEDITDRKFAEEALAAVSARHEAMLSAIPDIIMEVNADRVYTWANRAGLAFFGEDVVGKEAAYYFEGEQNTYEAVRPIFEGGEDVVYIESWQRRRDGQKRLLAWSCRVLKDSHGKVVGALSSAKDITEQRQSEEKFKVVFDGALDGILVADLATKSFMTGNAAICDMLGYTIDEIRGLSVFDIHPREDLAYVLEQFDRQARREIELARDIPVRRKDGSIFHADINSTPVVISGKQYLLGFFRDVTEHRKLEDQLRQAQKMEAIGHLAGGVAHDFNNMLTAIIGYGSLLSSKIPLDDPLHAYVDQILASSAKATNLTHSLLAFSRKQVIDPKQIDINDIILHVQKILDRIIGEDIRFEVDTAGDELMVRVDQSQIEQVLINLATNARDAMPRGGSLKISTELAEIEGRAGKFAAVSVADTGTGMDDKTKERIFEPFYTTKEIGKGTGLGLSMVYGTVSQHNGFIDVHSEPGVGTTFTIYLPLMDTCSPAAGENARPALYRGSETILLVEDEAPVRRIIRMLLEELGYTVMEASDAENALAIFRDSGASIHLVVSDVVMPGMSGKELHDEIRKIRQDARFLFISGYTSDILGRKGFLEEGVYFMPKPLRPDAFSAKIREALQDCSTR